MSDDDQKLLNLMDDLIQALEGLHAEPTLRQMYLETQWMRQNLANGNVVIPSGWQLLIFKRPAVLHEYRVAAKSARKLADELSRYIANQTATRDE